MKNREMKFRAWNGMEMVYDITVGRFGSFYVNPEKGDGLDPNDSASLTPCNTKYPDSVAIMQYTGLIDKNGKEIYEGDILNFLWDKKAEGGGYICGSRGFQQENEALVYFERGCFYLEGHGNLHEKISFNQSALGWTVVGNKFDERRLLAVAH